MHPEDVQRVYDLIAFAKDLRGAKQMAALTKAQQILKPHTKPLLGGFIRSA